MSRRREPEVASIASVTHDGRGIASLPGKKVFVAGALAGETVRFQRRKRRRNFDEAELLEVLEPVAERIEPRCAAYGRCGGCSLQHITAASQREIKMQSLVESLERIGQVTPDRWLVPVYCDDVNGSWNYRRRARLAVKDVHAKGRVLVGFRERHAPFIADMQRCEVLGEPVASLLPALSELIGRLSIRQRLPQIEVAIADNNTELVFRVLDPPSEQDRAMLANFAAQYDLRVALQSGGLDSVEALTENPGSLYYRLDEFDVELEFDANDFVQVNAKVNERMVSRTIELLEPTKDNRVLDLFCGIGNFSLPLARRAGHVLGLELSVAQVERAKRNATRNNIDNSEFACADLSELDGSERWLNGEWDRVLLDPARSGADAVARHMRRTGAARVVYVSCHPGTLARDAAELVGNQGYRLAAAGIIDMFPHTAHVESIAVFEKIIKK